MGRVTSRASRATSAHSFLEARDTGVSTSFRRFARGLVLVALLLPACGTVQRERTPAETEALLQSVLARVAADDVLELWSPASASASATFLATAREQADLVRSLFEAPVDPPIRVYLVPTAMDERKDARGLPNPASQGGKEGGSFDEGFLFQFVPAGASERELLDRGSLATDTLRHEYAHAYSLRVGLLRAPWFHEGLATEVEYARLAPGVVVLSTYPHRWITARATLREGALVELLAWRRGETLAAERGERLYAHAHAFFRFLLEREASGTFLEKVRRIHALPDAELAALEPAWLAWWRALDPLEAVRIGAHAPDPADRDRAASRMPVLAESRVPEFATRAADELALDLLSDPAAREGAARFLLFFRVYNLLAADLERLERDALPAVRLVAAALRVKREERCDLERAYADWGAVSADERATLLLVSATIPGLVTR